jgi:hypothetical protein
MVAPIANIGTAEVTLMLVVGVVVLAGFVGLVALAVRIGTRGLRQRL